MASHKESEGGDRVLLTCSCYALSPVTRLYFCRHCIKLRCPLCVSHEVDSYYCPNCLENMPSAEAKLKKNRCANCFDCPSCGNTLSTRATAIAIPSESVSPEAKATQAKKVYYLACGFCRWSSRDVGIEDKNVASGGWQDKENSSTKRISTLVEFYRQLAQKEKVEREKKKLTKRRNYMHLTLTSKNKKDKFGLSSLTRRKSNLSYLTANLNPNHKETTDAEISLKDPSEANEEVDILPEVHYTKALVLEEVPLLSQRLAQPDFQPEDIQDLYPRHKHLLAKRSQRCRECEHNLCKPEFNPSSIKFKIQLGAVYYVPRLRIAKVADLKLDKECAVTLSFTNPLENVVKVVLLQLIEGTGDNKEGGQRDKEENVKKDGEKNGPVNEQADKTAEKNENEGKDEDPKDVKAKSEKTEKTEKNGNEVMRVKAEGNDEDPMDVQAKSGKTEKTEKNGNEVMRVKAEGNDEDPMDVQAKSGKTEKTGELEMKVERTEKNGNEVSVNAEGKDEDPMDVQAKSEKTEKTEKNGNEVMRVKAEGKDEDPMDVQAKSENTEKKGEVGMKMERTEEGEKEAKGKPEKTEEEKKGQSGKEKVAGTSSLSVTNPGRFMNNRCDSRAFEPTAEVILPTFPLVLAARDDAAEFDEGFTSNEMFNDDPRVVTDRQANKLWFVIKVIPKKTCGDVKFSMIVQYDYKHASTALVRAGTQEPADQAVTLRHKVHINLGSTDDWGGRHT